MSESIIKPTHGTKITTASGTYTTAKWAAGTNTCTWTAPQNGQYLVWMYFSIQDPTETQINAYVQLHMMGTATRHVGASLWWAGGGSSTIRMRINTICQPVTATKGQTIYPYIHTDIAGTVFTVKIVAVLL